MDVGKWGHRHGPLSFTLVLIYWVRCAIHSLRVLDVLSLLLLFENLLSHDLLVVGLGYQVWLNRVLSDFDADVVV